LPKFIQSSFEWLYRARRKAATCSVIVLACLVAWHVVFGANGLLVYAQKRTEQRELQTQIESLKRQNELLDKRIKALKSDPQTIEKEAREKFGYARPGEIIYTLPTVNPAMASTTSKR